MSVEELEQGADRVVMRTALPRLSSENAFAHFVEPMLLARWWAPAAEVDARPGGWYHLWWPTQNRHLRGRYTIFERGRSLGFTWQWDHEPEQPLRHVALDFASPPGGEGSIVTLTHAVYGESAPEQAQRESHLDGWRHFLTRLREVRGT